MIEQKIINARALIARHLEGARAPVVMVSFGKDSMVMLWLMRQLRKDVPVFFFREPFQEGKFDFANQVVKEWGLDVRTALPIAVDLVGKGDELLEIVNVFSLGGNGTMYLPTGINHTQEPDASWECGCEVLNKRLDPEAVWPWDVVFIGHKSSDVDPIQGRLALKGDTAEIGNATLVYPLHDWTDEDVWAATQKHYIPQDYQRYDPFDSFKELPDRKHNPDWMDICAKCLQHGESATVMCPKVEVEVPRIGAGIDYEARAVQWRQRLTNIAQT